MPTLLRIDSSPLPSDASFSRQLTREFVERWRETHPGAAVIARDLNRTAIPAIGAEWVAANQTPEASLTARQQEVLSLSNELIRELHAADEYVFGVPMHNFGVPSSLKLWIDQVVRAGKTFAYENGARAGLLNNKKATFLIASGGVYDQGTPMAAMNFVEPYLRSVFGFLGVTDLLFINAAGVARLWNGVDRETILQPALESVRGLFEGALQPA
jgi:FMN-dependent NADH-azoreductase